MGLPLALRAVPPSINIPVPEPSALERDVSRRDMLALAASVGAASAFSIPASAQQGPGPPDADPRWCSTHHMLVHPRMVMQDLVGRLTVFDVLRCRIDLVWTDNMPVSTKLDIPVTTTRTFAEGRRGAGRAICPRRDAGDDRLHERSRHRPESWGPG